MEWEGGSEQRGRSPQPWFWALHQSRSVLAPGTSLTKGHVELPERAHSLSNHVAMPTSFNPRWQRPVSQQAEPNGHRVFQLFGSAENPRAACMRGTSGFPGAGRPARKSGSRENGGAPSRTREAPADAAKGRVARQGTKGGVVSSVLAESEMSREWLTMAFPTRFAGTLESGTGVPGQPFPRYLEQQGASNAF